MRNILHLFMKVLPHVVFPAYFARLGWIRRVVTHVLQLPALGSGARAVLLQALAHIPSETDAKGETRVCGFLAALLRVLLLALGTGSSSVGLSTKER
jgi:hypothetical protein